MKNQYDLFSIKSILPHLILIGITVIIYYAVNLSGLFPQWIDSIYTGGKVAIGFLIVLASARSIVMPILALIGGLLILFTCQAYDITLISPTEAWELLVMAFIGLIITILVKW